MDEQQEKRGLPDQIQVKTHAQSSKTLAASIASMFAHLTYKGGSRFRPETPSTKRHDMLAQQARRAKKKRARRAKAATATRNIVASL